MAEIILSDIVALQRDMLATKHEIQQLRGEVTQMLSLLREIRAEGERGFAIRLRDFFIFSIAYMDGYVHRAMKWKPTRQEPEIAEQLITQGDESPSGSWARANKFMAIFAKFI